ELSQVDFMKLIIAQMQNQNPGAAVGYGLHGPDGPVRVAEPDEDRG
ncbi:MAG: hypothetical protein IPL66_07870, partial [Dehalococcoidia bacterium]|nr:hypothetical protein [Dehalococcoidia bacterium]